MRDMELRQLRSFVVLAEELHFRRAAERLHIAQPSLSQQLRRLEDGLGVRLLERDRRSVALTPAGEALLPEARAVLAAADHAAAVVRATAAGERGVRGAVYRRFAAPEPTMGMALAWRRGTDLPALRRLREVAEAARRPLH